jgi:hypothetical protein
MRIDGEITESRDPVIITFDRLTRLTQLNFVSPRIVLLTVVQNKMTRAMLSPALFLMIVRCALCVQSDFLDSMFNQQFIPTRAPTRSPTSWPTLLVPAQQIWSRTWEGSSSDTDRAKHLEKTYVKLIEIAKIRKDYDEMRRYTKQLDSLRTLLQAEKSDGDTEKQNSEHRPKKLKLRTFSRTDVVHKFHTKTTKGAGEHAADASWGTGHTDQVPLPRTKPTVSSVLATAALSQAAVNTEAADDDD